MLVADILRKKGGTVATVKADSTLKSAVQLLQERRIGAVLVSPDGLAIEGILSERDIVRALASSSFDLDARLVADLMVADVHTCEPDATVSEVMAMMNARRIRHVPVVRSGAGLCGIVSIGDIVKALLEESDDERRRMAEYIADR